MRKTTRSPARPSTCSAMCSCATWPTAPSPGASALASTWRGVVAGGDAGRRPPTGRSGSPSTTPRRMTWRPPRATQGSLAGGRPGGRAVLSAATRTRAASTRPVAVAVPTCPVPDGARRSRPGRARSCGAGRAALGGRRFAEAEDDLTRRHGAVRGADDVVGAADAKVMLARSRFERGDIDGEGPLLHQAMRELEAQPPGPALAHAATRVAGHLWVVGDYPRCVRWSDRALTLARELDLLREQVLALQYRGASRSKMGDSRGARRPRGGAAHGRRSRPRRGDRRSPTTTTPTNSGSTAGRGPRSRPGRRWRRSAASGASRPRSPGPGAGSLEPLFDVGAWDRVLCTSAELRAWDVDHGGGTHPGAVALSFQGWVTLRRGELEVAVRVRGSPDGPMPVISAPPSTCPRR